MFTKGLSKNEEATLIALLARMGRPLSAEVKKALFLAELAEYPAPFPPHTALRFVAYGCTDAWISTKLKRERSTFTSWLTRASFPGYRGPYNRLGVALWWLEGLRGAARKAEKDRGLAWWDSLSTAFATRHEPMLERMITAHKPGEYPTQRIIAEDVGRTKMAGTVHCRPTSYNCLFSKLPHCENLLAKVCKTQWKIKILVFKHAHNCL